MRKSGLDTSYCFFICGTNRPNHHEKPYGTRQNWRLPPPKVSSVTLDRTLGYKLHTHITKMKVATCYNLLRKLSNSKWSANASTIRTTALALIYSVANTRHQSGRDHVEDMYLLAGISPPGIRRYVCATMEKTKQETNEAHSLYGLHPAERSPGTASCVV